MVLSVCAMLIFGWISIRVVQIFINLFSEPSSLDKFSAEHTKCTKNSKISRLNLKNAERYANSITQALWKSELSREKTCSKEHICFAQLNKNLITCSTLVKIRECHTSAYYSCPHNEISPRTPSPHFYILMHYNCWENYRALTSEIYMQEEGKCDISGYTNWCVIFYL